MRGKTLIWLVTAVTLLIVMWVWILTIQHGRSILGQEEEHNRDPIPYYGR